MEEYYNRQTYSRFKLQQETQARNAHTAVIKALKQWDSPPCAEPPIPFQWVPVQQESPEKEKIFSPRKMEIKGKNNNWRNQNLGDVHPEKNLKSINCKSGSGRRTWQGTQGQDRRLSF